MSQFLTSQLDIQRWLKDHNVWDYTFQPDLSVSVHGDLNLKEAVKSSGEIIERLPVQFAMVSGDCNLENIGLLSLVGSPRTVDGTFSCAHNELTTLSGAPGLVGENFWCDHNYLINLEGSPIHVGGTYNCAYNSLITLEGISAIIQGSFYCQDNFLTSLEYSPTTISGEYCCSRNQLTSLKGLQADMEIMVVCEDNPDLTSLGSVPQFENKDLVFIFDETNFVELQSFYEAKKNNWRQECSITYSVLENYRQAWNDKHLIETQLSASTIKPKEVVQTYKI